MAGSEVLRTIVTEVEFREIAVGVGVGGATRHTHGLIGECSDVVRSGNVPFALPHTEEEHPAHPVIGGEGALVVQCGLQVHLVPSVVGTGQRHVVVAAADGFVDEFSGVLVAACSPRVGR